MVTEYRKTYQGIVYPAQCDAMGHMTVQHYVAAFDQAMWGLVYGLGWRPHPDPSTTGIVDVRHVVDYRSELIAGTPFCVESRVARCGRSSLETHHVMRAVVGEAVSAELTMTSIQFDLKRRSSTPFSDDMRALLLG